MNNKSRRLRPNKTTMPLRKQMTSQRSRSPTKTSSMASAESYRNDKERAITSFFRKKKTKSRKAGLPAYKKRPVVKGKKKTNDINSGWSFSVINLSRYALKDAAMEMVEKSYTKLITYSQNKPLPFERLVDIKKAVTAFVNKVEQNYNESRFHNFKHAVDVTQMVYFLLTKYFIKRIKPEEMFYLIVAALCHDIFHPGACYPFMKKKGFLLEESSLEEYHAKKTVELITSKDLKLFQKPFLNTNQQKDIVEYVNYLISATNIGKHEAFIKQAERNKIRRDALLKKEHMAILLKISDLANISRDFEDSWKWSINFKIETSAEKELEKVEEKPKNMDELTNNLLILQESFDKKFREEQSLSEGTADTTLKFMKHFARRLVSCLKDLNIDAGVRYGARIRKNQEKWSSFKRNEAKKG